MSQVVPLLKFTPSAQDPEILETITVQRESLIAKLVEIALDTVGGPRHQLLIGPRGIGKTHILSLVASRIRAEARSSAVTLAWLEEDPWSISSYEKFLAAIVARVAAENADPALAERADTLHASRDRSGREAEQVLRDALDGTRLVLLVENLDDIFKRIGDNGQERFRAFVEDSGQVLVLATAPQLFEGVQLHKSPFYGFFAITPLDELSLDSAAELMRRVAELRGDDELVKFLATDVARRRLAAIEALAGGHPRIWILLSGCVSIKAIDALVPLFLEALDDLTPYYQDRLRELSVQQQELVVLLSEAGGALSNRALAERSGIAQNQIATMLRQLTDRGYVRRAEISDEIATGDARMSFWELREPLMRLCLDVKQARGRPLRMVVEFLRAWYGPRLLDELAALPASAELAATYASEAFRTFEDVLPPAELFRGTASEVLARAELGLSLTPDRADLRLARAAALAMEDRLEEARDAFRALEDDDLAAVKLSAGVERVAIQKQLGEPVDPGDLVAGLIEFGDEEPDDVIALGIVVWGLLTLDRVDEAVDAFHRLIALDPEDAMEVANFGHRLGGFDRHEEALEAFTRAVELEPTNAQHHANRSIALLKLGRDEEALSASARAAELDPEDGVRQERLGAVLDRVGRHEDALRAFERAAELGPVRASMHANRGLALIALDRPEDALDAFERAIEIDPESLELQNNLGAVLVDLRRYEDGLSVLRRASELGLEGAALQHNIGTALRHLGRHEEALAAFAKGFELDPSVVALLERQGAMLDEQDRLEEAVAVLGYCVEIAPSRPEAFNGQANVLRRLGQLDRAEEAALRAIELDDEDAVYRFTLAEVSITRGDVEGGVARLRDALSVWSQTEGIPAGDTELLCRILWENPNGMVDRRAAIDQIVAAYDEAGAGEELGRGLVSSIAWMVESGVSVDRARAWVADWPTDSESEGLVIPLRLLRAAGAWKEDRDRSHLLELPAEQREILINLIAPEGQESDS